MTYSLVTTPYTLQLITTPILVNLFGFVTMGIVAKTSYPRAPIMFYKDFLEIHYVHVFIKIYLIFRPHTVLHQSLIGVT